MYIHAYTPTKTQHPNPFNYLLTRHLLTKHVEEFFPLSHPMQGSSQEHDATAKRADLRARTAVTRSNVTPDKLC